VRDRTFKRRTLKSLARDRKARKEGSAVAASACAMMFAEAISRLPARSRLSTGNYLKSEKKRLLGRHKTEGTLCYFQWLQLAAIELTFDHLDLISRVTDALKKWRRNGKLP
jgi:hypothetical protein